MGRYGKTMYIRPSKCPKIYTTMISGEENIRQKERKFCQKENCDNLQ